MKPSTRLTARRVVLGTLALAGVAAAAPGAQARTRRAVPARPAVQATSAAEAVAPAAEPPRAGAIDAAAAPLPATAAARSNGAAALLAPTAEGGAEAARPRNGAPVGAPAGQPADDDWLAETPKATPAPVGHPLRQAAALLVVAGLAGAAGAAWQRRRPRREGKQDQERIDLLAVRSLGGKQRLALVEVCGERLLLASCEQEVTLLSHLAGGTAGEAAAAEGVMPASEPAASATLAAPAADHAVGLAAAAVPSFASPGAVAQYPTTGEAPPPVAAPAFATALAERLGPRASHGVPPSAPFAPAAAPAASVATAHPADDADALPVQAFSSDLAGLRAWRTGHDQQGQA